MTSMFSGKGPKPETWLVERRIIDCQRVVRSALDKANLMQHHMLHRQPDFHEMQELIKDLKRASELLK